MFGALNTEEKKGKFSIRENVEYTLRHCDDCAKGECDKAGTPHGELKNIFQENKLGAWLAKKGFGNQVLASIPFLFGKYSPTKKISNLVTSAGQAAVASRINGSGGEAAFTYIAIGVGTTAAAAGDTTLVSETTTGGGARAAATASRATTDVTNDTAQLQLTFTFSASFAITESGVLNASSAGVLLARQVFTAVNVVSGDSLQVTWKFDVD